MLNTSKVNHIKRLLDEGSSLKKVARTCKVSINTVRRIDRGIEVKPNLSKTYNSLIKKRDEVRKLFFDCEGNCNVMLRSIEKTIGAVPSQRTLQRFCKPFRIEMKQASTSRAGMKHRLAASFK